MQDSEQGHHVGSGWVIDGMVDVQGLATVVFLVNSYGFLICFSFWMQWASQVV